MSWYTDRDSNLPFKVELVDWHRITEEFQKHIQTHWQRLEISNAQE